MIYFCPPTRITTMTDESDVSRTASNDAGHKSAKTQAPENVQSLTDFFDQRGRAAFKRALENRDSLRAELDNDAETAERQKR